jgi:hypothetical protein
MQEENLTPLSAITTPNYDILDQLENYEDYLSFYIQLEEAQAGVAWLKADTLLHMTKKLGNDSPAQLAKDLKLPPSTTANYIRVAKAFPPDKREELLTFSGHLEASFADSYNDSTGEFQGVKRFEWVKKAAEEQLPTRQLKKQISDSKQDDESIREIDDYVRDIFQFIGSLKDKAKKGDKEALAKIHQIHILIFENA